MGSLFKLRDHWYGSYRGEEFSHTSALTLGNAANSPDDENEIIFGSFSGTLRVLLPKKKGAMQPEDTLVEKDFGAPILQVACRPLEPVVGGQPRNLIAVLSPRQLFLARLFCERNTEVEEGNTSALLNKSYRLTVHYEARLDSTAYNFTCGRFGHAPNEMVCVQSMDGQLTIVNHNSVVSHCFLPSSQFLLPGCFAYCPQRDYFVTNSSSMNLLCYSFANLTSNRVRSETHLGADENDIANPHGDAISPSWTFLLGEEAVGIEVCRHTRGLSAEDADIVVLCHYSLFVLRLNGEMRFSRRLDVETLCLTTYTVPGAEACNLLIGTVKGSVNVYSDASLDWSAKMTTNAPQCLAVGELLKTKGMIVTLATDGTVAVNYLGTDPEEDPIQPLESKEADYVEMERELRRTMHAIKQSCRDDKAPGKETAAVEGLLRVEWDALPSEVEGRDGAVTSPLVFTNTSATDSVGEVTIAVHVVEPVRVDVPQQVLENVPAGQTVRVPFRFDAQNNTDMIIPSSLEARAVVTYAARNGAICTVSVTARLPLTLVARPYPSREKCAFCHAAQHQ
ncbi:Bardet-Biedl syndrome 9 [Trypanosoma conorhini]|uniref:Bardet-Biedl syndrome 9 n=1 Tax=Trypanosoma conorhini TaxID=83891 RepID=A0A3S5IU22_9TRYP|nr:Bardet-Biedl syndrome 9 [Trypanosoma conorhini]RNF24305.1 Bardet-Biedl syndrome 9 [Trypanosoma conorhini]